MSIMLSVTNKPCKPSVIMLNVFMLRVVMLNVMAPWKGLAVKNALAYLAGASRTREKVF